MGNGNDPSDIAGIVPAVQCFKFGVWAHDAVVLHEHDIRKGKGPFAVLLTNRALRERFYGDLNRLVEAAPMTIFAAVIDKDRLRTRYADTWNPYGIALHFCIISSEAVTALVALLGAYFSDSGRGFH